MKAGDEPRPTQRRPTLRGAAGARRFDQGPERTRVAHGHVREDLPVQLDARLGQPVDELGVAHALGPGGGADPGDPQAAELALAVAAVAVRVHTGVHDLLLGHAKAPGPRAAIALRGLHDLAALLPRVDG